MEEVLSTCGEMIESCADKLCRRFRCPGLREDLVSAGRIAVLEQAAGYQPDGGASVTTYLYPFVLGAMRRELEQSLFPLGFSKRGFAKQIREKSFAFVSLDEFREDEDGETPKVEPASSVSVEHAVYTKIYVELLKKEFDRCSFKDKEILGGLYGVFGYAMQTPEELAFTFQITESAVMKARDRILNKLRDACLNGELGVWKEVRRMLRAAMRDTAVFKQTDAKPASKRISVCDLITLPPRFILRFFMLEGCPDLCLEIDDYDGASPTAQQKPCLLCREERDGKETARIIVLNIH